MTAIAGCTLKVWTPDSSRKDPAEVERRKEIIYQVVEVEIMGRECFVAAFRCWWRVLV